MEAELTIRTFDGKELIVPIDSIFQSNLIRSLLDDRQSLDAMELVHESCTFDALSVLFHMIANADLDSVNLTSHLHSEKGFKVFQAAMYLDIEAVLCKLSTMPGMLHLMSTKGCLDAVRAMIERKADINEKNAEGKTPLEITNDAECRQELEGMLLIRKGYTPLLVAAYHGNTETLLAIINSMEDKIACLRVRDPCDQHNALHIASRKGHSGTVCALLHAKADIHEVTEDDMTALHLAARHGHDDVVELLLHAGASVNAKPKCFSPLHLAARHGHSSIASTLLSAQADINAGATMHSCWFCEQRVTPLHIAVSANKTDTITLLLDARASPFITKYGDCGSGLTPLHVAAKRGNAAAVRALLAAGADPCAEADMTCAETEWTGYAGVTPLHFACSSVSSLIACPQEGLEGLEGVVRALLAARADPMAEVEACDLVAYDKGRRDGWSAVRCAEAAAAGIGARTSEVLVMLRAAPTRRRGIRRSAAEEVAEVEEGGVGLGPDSRAERLRQLCKGRRGSGGGHARALKRRRRMARKGRRMGRQANTGKMELLWGWVAEV